jgi:molybdopterin molybdotransferase
LTGLPHLHELRMRFGSDLAVWPFEAPEAPIVLAEIYPSLLKAVIEAQRKPDEVLDCAQVRVMAQAVWALDPHVIEDMLRAGDPEEGWILGVGHEDVLAQAARKKDDT